MSEKNTESDFSKNLKTTQGIINSTFTSPAEGIKNKISKFESKYFTIFFVVTAILEASLLSLFSTMLNTVASDGYSAYGSYRRIIDWGALNDINYLWTFCANILATAIVIGIISAIIYIVALILKKNLNILKIVGTVSAGIIPFSAFILLGNFVNLFAANSMLVFILFGIIWSGIVIGFAINSEAKFSGNRKAFFNILAITLIAFCLIKIASNYLSLADFYYQIF